MKPWLVIEKNVVDEAGAFQNLLRSDKRRKVITVSEIEHIVSKIARIPLKKISIRDKDILKNLPYFINILLHSVL